MLSKLKYSMVCLYNCECKDFANRIKAKNTWEENSGEMIPTYTVDIISILNVIWNVWKLFSLSNLSGATYPK